MHEVIQFQIIDREAPIDQNQGLGPIVVVVHKAVVINKEIGDGEPRDVQTAASGGLSQVGQATKEAARRRFEGNGDGAASSVTAPGWCPGRPAILWPTAVLVRWSRACWVCPGRPAILWHLAGLW